MKRNNLYDFLIMLLLYIGLTAIPFARFIKIDWLVVVFRILIQTGLFFFFEWYSKKRTELNLKTGKFSLRNTLILLPVLVACFSNLIYTGICGGEITFNFNYLMILNIVYFSISVINEELIFRLFLLNNLEYKSKLVSIIVSSLVFGGIHLVNLIGYFDPMVFVQVLYTFGLGLLLGAVFVLTNSLVAPIVVHFLFNVFNDVIYGGFSFVGNSRTYYIVNVVVAGAVLLYVVTFIFVKRLISKKQN